MPSFYAAIVLGLAPQGPAEESIAWVRAHSFPFETVEAGHGFDDLAPLEELVGEARIVALGECTHGSREVFQMKHRLLEFLASEMGFTIFSIEASTPEAYAVDAFVGSGEGNPTELIRGMYFWTWSTAEVLDMVRWMHDWGREHDPRIAFTGFDMQTPTVAQEIVLEFLEAHAPGDLAEARRAYSEAAGRPSSGFGVATGTFPIDACRGRRIRFSGWIRTAGLTGGRAGLWWRADGPRGVLAFDNMQARGPSGDTDWTEYALELDIPEEVVNVNFGALLPGSGSAWFDGLSISIDGEAWVPPSDVDLDFEAPTVRGFFTPAMDYEIAVDTSQARVGRRSLRIAKREDEPGAVDAEAHVLSVAGVRERLEALREAPSAATSADELAWALHNATIVEQGARMLAAGSMGGMVRDESMARNVGWILERHPDARIVLWAHNGHVARAPGSMGSHLSRAFGDDYVVIGFATAAGTYTAVDRGRGVVRDNELQPPPEGSVEAVLLATEAPRLVLDLGAADAADPASGFLARPTPFRSIGALSTEQQFFPANVALAYDALVWIAQTSASREMR